MAGIAKMVLFLALAMAFLTMSPQLSSGQVAPAPAPNCNQDIVQLLPCLGFLDNSSITTPTPTCCSALSNVSTASPYCLCELISPSNANATAALHINDTRALELPGLCSLSVSPANCAAILGPSVAPAPVGLGPASAPAPITPAPASSPSSLTPVPAPGATSPSPALGAPSPLADCSAVTTELLSCVSFLTDSASSPSTSCCKSLGVVVASSPTCLCELAEQSGSLASSVNATRVTELPALCSVSVSLSDCSSAGAPSGGTPSGPGSSPSGSFAHRAVASNLFIVIGLCLVSFTHALLH